MSSALIVIDVQNDFCPGGALAVPEGDQIVEGINALMDDFDAVIDTCNAGRFGLHAGVFTRDIDRALHAFDRLEYGGVILNDVPTFRIDNFPYGGVKDSGAGREGVRWAVEEMTEPKVLVIRKGS